VGGINADPGSCQTQFGLPANTQLQYCFDRNVNLHHNAITRNSSTGDELFSATPAGAGGVTICNGSDFYKFNYNWVCGNLSTGDGGGVAHIGFSYNGDIEHNSILFNQSTNPTIPTNGGGLLVMGAPDVDPTSGGTTDTDCLNPTPIARAMHRSRLVINANLFQVMRPRVAAVAASPCRTSRVRTYSPSRTTRPVGMRWTSPTTSSTTTSRAGTEPVSPCTTP
jgi:hypothetical protein